MPRASATKAPRGRATTPSTQGAYGVASFTVRDVLTEEDLDYYLYDKEPSSLFVEPIAKDDGYTYKGPRLSGLSSGTRYWLAIENAMHSEVTVTFKIMLALE